MKEFEMNDEIIYSLIIDDMDNSISDDNKQLLEQWRQAAEANERIYQEFWSVQINMDKLFKQRGHDAQSSWKVLDQKLDVHHRLKLAATRRRSSTSLWFGIAASVFLVISMGYYFGFKHMDTTISTGEQARYIVLPDGTGIDLNAGTTISYNKQRFLKDRKLELINGEVFINVTNHNLPQFKIIIGEVEALDIGTSFSVTRTPKTIKVIVEKGMVALKQSSTNKELMLTTGKLGIYDLGTKRLSAVDNVNPNYKSWINKQFVFKEVPLQEVIVQLSGVYKEPILIMDKELRNRKLTAKLHYQTLDSVIAVISASLQCKAVKSKGTYTISED